MGSTQAVALSASPRQLATAHDIIAWGFAGVVAVVFLSACLDRPNPPIDALYPLGIGAFLSLAIVDLYLWRLDALMFDIGALVLYVYIYLKLFGPPGLSVRLSNLLPRWSR